MTSSDNLGEDVTGVVLHYLHLTISTCEEYHRDFH